MSLRDDAAASFVCPRYGDLPEVELYMDQVVSLLDKRLSALCDDDNSIATSTMINNYVKQRVISPPVRKKYDRNHIAKLIIIFIMKRVFSISEIKLLLDEITLAESFTDAYDRFAAEIDNVLGVTFNRTADGIQEYLASSGSGYGGAELDPELEDADDRLELVLKCAALAFACKLYAQRVLCDARERRK